MKNQEFKSFLIACNIDSVQSWQAVAKEILQLEGNKLCVINAKYKDSLLFIAELPLCNKFYTNDMYWSVIDDMCNSLWVYEIDSIRYIIEDHNSTIFAVEEGYTLFED